MTEQAEEHQLSIEDIKPKMRLQGRVKSVGLHGAVIDVGLEYSGLLHVSQLSADNDVEVVSEVVSPGDEVAVWVVEVMPEQKRVSLTMVEPPDVTWTELQEGRVFPGKVTRIEQYGAFVDVGAERPGLLHVREMSAGYVEHPSELVSVGDEIDVRILRVDRRRQRIDLTRQGLEAEAVAEPEPEDNAAPDEAESPLTAMELAMERARAETDREDVDEKRERKQEKAAYTEREDILERTLRQHSESDTEPE
ncbi:MAG: S1 RNA-binding domain-containing protein [Anaerolineae bacterium]